MLNVKIIKITILNINYKVQYKVNIKYKHELNQLKQHISSPRHLLQIYIYFLKLRYKYICYEDAHCFRYFCDFFLFVE